MYDYKSVFKFKEENWLIKYINREINNDFIELFGHNGGRINVLEPNQYDLTLTVVVASGYVTKVEYCKSNEIGGPRPKTNYQDLSKRDIKNITNILDRCTIDKSELIFKDIEAKINDLSWECLNSGKNLFIFKNGKNKVEISKKQLIDTINISFVYIDITYEKEIWRANNLDISIFPIIKDLFSLIDLRQYPLYSKLLNEANTRKKEYIDYLNYPKLKKALLQNDFACIDNFPGSLRYIKGDSGFSSKRIMEIRNYLFENNIQLFRQFILLLNVGIDDMIVDFIDNNEYVKLNLLDINRYPNEYNYYDFYGKTDCLKVLIDKGYSWPNNSPYNKMPPHLIEVVDSIGPDKIRWDKYIIEYLLKHNRVDLVVEAIKTKTIINKLDLYIVLNYLQKSNDFNSINTIINIEEKRIFDFSDLNEIPTFILDSFENHNSESCLLIIDKVKENNQKAYLSLILEEMIRGKSELKEIETFIKNNSFSTNDFILSNLYFKNTNGKNEFLYNKNSEYTGLILNQYNSANNIFSKPHQQELEDIVNIYLMNNSLDDVYGTKFGFEKFIRNPYLSVIISDLGFENNYELQDDFRLKYNV